MHIRLVGALASAALSTIALSGCSNVNPMGMMEQVIGTAQSAYSASDLMFAAMMIPHHEQALTMADLALNISKNPEITHLATHIKDAQHPEIAQMRGWLEAAGQLGMLDMPGHDHGAMQGMLDDAAMSALSAATGSAFDKLFLQGMIAHHEGALVMVDMINGSTNAEVTALGDSIRTTQQAEIDEMKSLLAKLG
ncbi:MAG TPA: DUF305 domain-containing protein [Microbacteriaceae bacterium]|nr:DUF305 domain-containing protein [Microbacteriaceae bacterium]